MGWMTKYVIINHEGRGFFFINFFFAFVSLGSCYLYLYCAAFRISFADYNKPDHEHSTHINNIMIGFELTFVINMLLSFFLSYKDDETQKRVVSLRMTSRRYFKE